MTGTRLILQRTLLKHRRLAFSQLLKLTRAKATSSAISLWCYRTALVHFLQRLSKSLRRIARMTSMQRLLSCSRQLLPMYDAMRQRFYRQKKALLLRLVPRSLNVLQRFCITLLLSQLAISTTLCSSLGLPSSCFSMKATQAPFHWDAWISILCHSMRQALLQAKTQSSYVSLFSASISRQILSSSCAPPIPHSSSRDSQVALTL